MLTLCAGVALAAVLSGTNGDDTLFGGRERDVIYGKGGNDTLGGQRGSDVVLGGPGNDSLADLGGDDVLYGGTGNDILFGDDVLQGVGGKGNDKLFGGKGETGWAAERGKTFSTVSKVRLH